MKKLPNFISYEGRLYGLLAEGIKTTSDDVLELNPIDVDRGKADVSAKTNQFLDWIQSNSFYGITGYDTTNHPGIQSEPGANGYYGIPELSELVNGMTHVNMVPDGHCSTIMGILSMSDIMATRYNDVFNENRFPGGFVKWLVNKIDIVLGCYDTDDLISSGPRARSEVYDMMSVLISFPPTQGELNNIRRDIMGLYNLIDSLICELDRSIKTLIQQVSTLISERLTVSNSELEESGLNRQIRRAVTSAINLDHATASSDNDWCATTLDTLFNGSCCEYTINAINQMIGLALLSPDWENILFKKKQVKTTANEMSAHEGCGDHVRSSLCRYVESVNMLIDAVFMSYCTQVLKDVDPLISHI